MRRATEARALGQPHRVVALTSRRTQILLVLILLVLVLVLVLPAPMGKRGGRPANPFLDAFASRPEHGCRGGDCMWGWRR